MSPSRNEYDGKNNRGNSESEIRRSAAYRQQSRQSEQSKRRQISSSRRGLESQQHYDPLEKRSRRINTSSNNPRISHTSNNPHSRLSSSNYSENHRYKNVSEIEAENENEAKSENKKNKKAKNKKNKKKSPIKTFFKIVFITFFICIFAVTGAVIGAIMGIIDKAPKLELIAIEPNVYTSIIYDSAGNEIDRLHGDENREYVTLDKIPKNMQNAIIAIEDERFYSHNGIDIKGIFRAAYSILTGQGVEGASTITQQLIKNNITKVISNNIETKIQEQYLAIKYENELEKQLGSRKAAKDYILELYLNTIYLNHGYNGIQAASLGYFNKDSSELDLAESAVLAGITNNPSYYSPRVHPENNKDRQKHILNNMLEQGLITKNEYDEAINEDVYSKISESSSKIEDTGKSVHSYFVDGLFEQISNDLQEQHNMSVAQANNIIYNGGLKIYSTLDQNIQNIVDSVYLDDSLFPNVSYSIDVTYTVSILDEQTNNQKNSEYRQFVKNKEEADNFAAAKKAEIQNGLTSSQKIIADKIEYAVQPQSAMVILDYHTGQVKALAGGRGEKVVNRGLNRAVDSARQPGSVFKVLAAFAPGIDLGVLTPATVIDDVPLDLNGYKPKNWYKNYRGLSTIREGIRDSMNIVAVKSMAKTGIDKCYEYLLNLGFTTLENDNHASTALGGLTKGVTQLEVTAAYGAIANGGNYLKPSLYSKVYDHNGEILLEQNTEPKQVFKATTAFLLTDMMKDVITAGTGTKAKFISSSMPISGKTGTTQNSKDLTFVGYTPYYAAGIWLGYDRYDDLVSDMSKLDQAAHLVVWRTIMEKIHENLEVKDFVKPEGIVSANICMESGKLAQSGLCDRDPRGSRVRTEFFADGTQPTEYCNVHKALTYCSTSGRLASKYCPSSSISSRIGIVRPEPYNGSESVADKQYEIPSGALNGAICNVHSEGGYSGEINGEENGEYEKESEDTSSENSNSNSDNNSGNNSSSSSNNNENQPDTNAPVINTPNDSTQSGAQNEEQNGVQDDTPKQNEQTPPQTPPDDIPVIPDAPDSNDNSNPGGDLEPKPTIESSQRPAAVSEMKDAPSINNGPM